MAGQSKNRTLGSGPNKLTLTVQNSTEIRLTVDAYNQDLDPANLARKIIDEHYDEETNILYVYSQAQAQALLRGITLEQYLRSILMDRFNGWDPPWEASDQVTAEKVFLGSVLVRQAQKLTQ